MKLTYSNNNGKYILTVRGLQRREEAAGLSAKEYCGGTSVTCEGGKVFLYKNHHEYLFGFVNGKEELPIDKFLTAFSHCIEAENRLRLILESTHHKETEKRFFTANINKTGEQCESK